MRRALVWIAPSAVAGCAGALAGGLIEGSGDGSRRLAIAGLVSVFAIPALIVASLAIRGVLRAWAPRALVASWREDRDAMPRLAAWAGVVWLATLALAWAMFQGTWMLANQTAFKPTSIGFAAPIVAVVTVLGIVALSRPCADGFTWLARKIDRLWQRFLPGTLLRPAIIFGGALLSAAGVFYLLWVLLVTRRLNDPELGLGFLLPPGAAIAAVIGVHLGWRAVPRALIRGIAGGAIAIAAIAVTWLGVRSIHASPEQALEIYAQHAIGRLAIDQLFDVESIRRDLPLDRVRPAARGEVHPDIVLITLDGVRADRTPPYGGSAPMPALAELAARGALFRSAYAPAPTTQRSIPTLVTGYAPLRVRGRSTAAALELDVRHFTLAERLQAAGYDTAVFACGSAAFAERTGWTRGFQAISLDDDVARLGLTAKTWLREREQHRPARPEFVWIHLSPARSPEIDGVSSLAERIALYDRSMIKVDAAIADAIAPFQTRAPDKGPIVIVVGDRGEELGEHGEPFRADDLYDTLLHVPMVAAGPTIKTLNVVETVGLVDIAPTILDLAGYQLPRSPPLDGRSLADAMTGKRVGLAITGMAFAILVPESRERSQVGAVIRNNVKLIDNGGNVELYDLATDPGERVNLAGQRMPQVAEMRALLNAKNRQNVPPF